MPSESLQITKQQSTFNWKYSSILHWLWPWIQKFTAAGCWTSFFLAIVIGTHRSAHFFYFYHSLSTRVCCLLKDKSVCVGLVPPNVGLTMAMMSFLSTPTEYDWPEKCQRSKNVSIGWNWEVWHCKNWKITNTDFYVTDKNLTLIENNHNIQMFQYQ